MPAKKAALAFGDKTPLERGRTRAGNMRGERLTSSAGPTAGGRTIGLSRIDARPYEVRIEGAAKGRFEDLRDAISSARIAELDRPLSRIAVIDKGTGQLVIEVDP